jgi:hypothetical protein
MAISTAMPTRLMMSCMQSIPVAKKKCIPVREEHGVALE